MYNNKLKGYTQDSLRSRVAGADPYQLVQLLMAGALENMSYAKGAIQRKDLEKKSVHLSKASAIIESLRSSLNMEVGGEVSENLDNLYLYMYDRLTEASLKNDVEIIDEVAKLLKQIKSAWDAIPMTEREVAMTQMQQQASGA
ncbi:flagellar export chaperone FliS [Idiomarina xiamenensis]|uniref:Flagellar secretion chaperone FliS n=1 Tax=Idiomarina xiamenensis 10-D-4 TaxID=740709 RepID=K2K2C2_9GAMM|nr:flagellar export chaperone FliS [Idiomarina xiamenensis]EKE80847.1 flagellin-specific chaperone FliS [Idiomarina xiamenensis 10-D-4]